MTDQQSSFEGFAILEIFGHQKYAGYVKTEYFGSECMLRLDIPPLQERERVTKGGCYVLEHRDGQGNELRSWVPPGSTVKEIATDGYSKMFGVKAIYSMTPCDEKACLAAVAELQPRPLMLVKLPEGKALTESTCPACGLLQSECSCLLSDMDDDEDNSTDEDPLCPVCHETMETCQCPLPQ
jgi:hypothetical protein